MNRKHSPLASLTLLLISWPALGQVQVTTTHVVTAHDRVPRFCASPTHVSTTDGAWSNPTTWGSAGVPGAEARVRIGPGTTVTYDGAVGSAPINCVEVSADAVLRWTTASSTRLETVHLQVLPHGALEIGGPGNPVPADVDATVVFRDARLQVNGVDPAQYGNGLHVFGRLTVHGRRVEPAFARLAADVATGSNSLATDSALAGWRAGDRVLLPDTRQIPFRKNHRYSSQAEVISVVSAGNESLVVAPPTAFGHAGPRDADGRVGPDERRMRPHVGNLTRNVVFRSRRLSESSKNRYCVEAENTAANGDCVTRGHVMVFARAQVDVRYAAFENLGRTTTSALDNARFDDAGRATRIGSNQVGRYSFHMHHLAGPVNPSNSGYQFRFQGNVIEGFLKWGLAVHNSHYGLVADNVVYAGDGAAIATEDGNESFNVFERNFIVHTRAGTTEQILESVGRGGVTEGRSRFGFTRDGFWFSGPNNIVRNNVVANAPDFAYNYNGYYVPRTQQIPAFRGADPATDGLSIRTPPVLESSGNEAYGATGQGLWLTWSSLCCNIAEYDEISEFKNFLIWHVNYSGVAAYHDARNTFSGFVMRNDPAVSEDSDGGVRRFNRGFDFSNTRYENGRTTISNADVQGFNIGAQLPPRPEEGTAEANLTRVEAGFFRNFVNIQQPLPRMSARQTLINGVQFGTLDHGPIPDVADEPANVQMRYGLDDHISLRVGGAKTILRNFDGVPGDDYEIYFTEQAPNFPIPPPPSISGPDFQGCPQANLTNQQCWDRHGVAVAGEVAPCRTRDGESDCRSARARAEALGVDGLAFPIRGSLVFADGFGG